MGEIRALKEVVLANPEKLKDPDVIKTLENCRNDYLNELYDFLKELNKNGLDITSLPGGKEFFISGDSEKAFRVTNSFCLRMFAKKMQGDSFEQNLNDTFQGFLRRINREYDWLDEEERKVLRETILELGLPAAIVPGAVLKDCDFITGYCQKYGIEENMNQVFSEIFAANYIEGIDQKLANQMGYNSLDELISVELANNPVLKEKNDNYFNRDKSKDLLYLAAIKTKTLTDLHNKGIDYVSVDLNSIPEAGINMVDASWNPKTNKITTFINKKSFRKDTLSHLGFYCMHETNHAIQDHNIKTCNIAEDPDIDLYAMDKLIRHMYIFRYQNDNYYRSNIACFSPEFDAEFKAEIEYFKLMNLTNPTDYLKQIVNTKADVESKVLEQLNFEKTFRHDMTRIIGDNVKRVDLESLFQKFISTMMEKPELAEEVMKSVDKDYPILKYKYQFFEKGVHKTSPRELVDEMEMAKSQLDLDAYAGIIRSSINPLKDKNAEQNISVYKSLLNYVPENVKGILSDILQSPSMDKYESMLMR